MFELMIRNHHRFLNSMKRCAETRWEKAVDPEDRMYEMGMTIAFGVAINELEKSFPWLLDNVSEPRCHRPGVQNAL